MKPEYSRKYITLRIDKPVYGNTVGIRAKYVLQAKKSGRLLRIITPNGTGTISASKFMKGSTMYQREFLVPGHPMTFYQNNVPIDKEKPQVVEDYSIPNQYRERLKEIAIEKGFYQRNLL